MLNDKFITQNVLEPTFLDNILDLVLTDEPNRIFTVKIEPPISSSTQDHLHVSLTWNYELKTSITVENHNSTKMNIRHSDFNKMKMFFNNIKWNIELKGLDVNQMYKKLIEYYQKAIDRFTPKFMQSNSKIIKKVYPKWFTTDLKNDIRLKYTLWHKLRVASVTNKTSINMVYKVVCKRIKNKMKKALFKYESELALEAKRNPKILYSYINQQKSIKDSIRVLKNSIGEVITDRIAIANCLNDQFFNAFSVPALNEEFPKIASNFSEKCIVGQNLFTPEAILIELTTLDTKKSAGGDGLHPHS